MKNNKGFTLVEILISLAIISILLLVLTPNLGKIMFDMRKNANDKTINSINLILKQDFSNRNGLKYTTDDLNATTTSYEKEFSEQYGLADDLDITFYGGDTLNTTVVKDVYNIVKSSSPSASSTLSIILPSNESTTSYVTSFNLNMNKPIIMILLTKDGISIYKNGLNVTDEYN